MRANSAATNQFLSLTLGFAGLKRLSKSVDTALVSAHTSIVQHVMPAIQAVMRDVHVLAGLALWQERIQQTGLDMCSVKSCLSAAECALHATEEAAQTCAAVACDLRHFFLLLQRCQKRCATHVVNEDWLASLMHETPHVPG